MSTGGLSSPIAVGANTRVTDIIRRRRSNMARARAAIGTTHPAISHLRASLRPGARIQKPWHLRVLQLRLCGFSVPAVAKALGRSARGIQNLVDTPHFQATLRDTLSTLRQKVLTDTLADPVFRRILDGGARSLDVLEQLRDGASDEAVRVRAASNLLDRYEKIASQPYDTGEDGMVATEATMDAIVLAIQKITVAVKLGDAPDATLEAMVPMPTCPLPA